MSSRSPSPKELLPGGIFSTRRAVRRGGGLMGIGIAVGLWCAGALLGWLFSGLIGGVVSFVFMVMALPVMPILGMPAAGGSTRLLLAVGISAALWWLLGQIVASRVARRPVVGWQEWTKEFVVMSMGLWLGAAVALALGAVLLGAL